jgi:hypothetical protein
VKLEHNWKQKTLENLQKEFWGDPEDDSFLVRRTYEIRKLPLEQLTVDDIAMMIRPHDSLEYMIPLAIDYLQNDILACGDSYEGALMEAVLKVDSLFWKKHPEHWNSVDNILKENQRDYGFDISKFDSGKA